MLRRLVLDVLKPHLPNNVELARELSKLSGVDGVSIITYNKETRVESVRIIIEGRSLNYEKIEKTLSKLGASIQSIDAVSAGKKTVRE